MKQAIITHKAYVEAQPKACPNLAKVVKSVEDLLEADPIAVLRRALDQPYKDYTFTAVTPPTAVCGSTPPVPLSTETL
jgi:hypothetical protein